MKSVWVRWVAALSVALLSACGGGGSGSAGGEPFGGPGTGTGTGGGGTTPPPTTTAVADLTIESPVQISNSISATATIVVTALDGNRTTVADAPVTLAVDNDAILTAASTTDASGKVEGILSVGPNRADRLLTVTATSGSVSKSVTVQVIGTRITATVPPTIAPGASGQVVYRVVDGAGAAMANQAVAITATGLTPATASGTTGSNGDYVFNFTAPATAGTYAINASVAGATDTQSLQVQATSSVPAVTATITSASLSASPSVVAVNQAGSTTNRSVIRALFLGPNNQPIANVRVRFDLAGDANSVGGTFTTGSTTLYTDANGTVTTEYVPGTQQSPTDGVTIRACYGKSDSDVNLANCTGTPPPPTTTLTVTRDALGVSIGTNELIVVNELSYVKRFLVTVTDSARAAKADVPLSVSLDLTEYRKGYYQLVGDAWAKASDTTCAAEDLNRNGVLETAPTNEDLNLNGRLDPGPSDVSVRLLSPKTGADGTAVVEIQYAKSFATWINGTITVAASGVSGTEGRATYRLTPIPADAAAITNKDVAPAFVVSPYGTATSCSSAN